MTSAINTFLRRAVHRLARLRTVALVSGYLGLGMAPAFADDIDIYVKSVSSGGGGAATIVFLLDSSGSMAWSVNSGSSPSNLIDQRSFQVKDAMRGQLTSLPGRYRVGVFRYSGSSGTKVADAEPLEKVLSETVPTGGTETIYIKDAADDVEQVSGQPMRLGEPGLDMSTRIQQDWFVVGVPASGAWTSAGGRNPNHAGNPRYYYQHTSSNDTQTFYLTSTGAPKVDTYLYLIDASTGDVLRTDNDISSGEYTCPGGWNKWGSDRCRRWCSKNDVKKHVPGCTDQNAWNYIDADWTPGNTNSAVTYTNLDKNAWYIIVAATNSAAGGEAGTFTLDLASPTRGKFWAPTEKVVDEQRVGLRFTDIEVPQGAVINKAYLRFKAEGATSDPTSLNVGYDRAATPSNFLGDDLYSRDIEWQPAFFNVDPWSDGESGSDTTFDVTSLMQQRVDDPAWCSGEVVMLVRGTGSGNDLRIAESFETAGDTGSGRPQLVIDWSPGPAVPSCNGVSMTFDIKTMTEDVYQDSAGNIYTNTSYLGVSDTMKTGLRFTLLPIPPGVTVTSAKLELVAYSTNSTPRPLIISTFADGLAAPFKSELKALDAREVNAGSVTWTPSSWVAGERYVSPELKDIVGPLFNNVGWERDGSIGFLLEGASSSSMYIRAWERTISGGNSMTLSNFGTMSARLHVTFTSPDPITTVMTHRRDLVEKVEALPASGGTPISGSYLEVVEYFLGRGGYTAPPLASGACATNTAIILTDGEEQTDYSSTHTSAVKDITGQSCTIKSVGGYEEAWDCTYDLMDALYEPAKWGVKGGDGNPFPYSVATHTVGFGPVSGTSGGQLKASGQHGGGAYHAAKDSAALVTIFEEVVGSVIDAGATIAAPGVAVNALNRFRHLDELYYSLFKPSTKVDWTGNLKRYRFKDGDVVDVTGAVAVDNEDRVFEETSHSWWSPSEDGVAVTSGGAAENLIAPDARKLYTYLGSNGTGINKSLYTPTTSQDGQDAESVQVTNSFLTPEMLGVDRLPEYETWTGLQVMAERDQVIAWARGGTDASPRKEFGAAIHGSPILVTYGFDADKNAINTVFVGDNQGILHMVDTGEPSSDSAGDNLANTGGKELFAFIPQELLPNLATLKQNAKSVLSDGYVYGLDGSWTAWKYDKDGDQTIEPSEDEHVYIYGGMRRGGKNVYALDVTTVNRSLPETKHDPRLLWVVQGGEAGTPYENMGQSWSDPSPRWIRWNGERRRVVFFGGGYDAAVHDDNQPFTDAAQLGRQLYMVDAVTGKLLWWGSSEANADTVVADMKYSITAAPVTVDRNANGYVDGIYVVDLAGQIIRFDLNEAAKDKDDLIRGTDVVAKLGATADGADAVKDNRRFYEAPTIGLARVQGSNDVLIALASGYREEPTDNATVERFFSLRDKGAWSTRPPTNDTLQVSSLASADGVEELSADDVAKPGWYLTFDKANAEKGIGTPVIFDFAVLFTSFMPKGAAAPSACAPDIGTSRLYFMDVITAKGLVDTDLTGASADGRYLDNAAIGIASRVQILVTDDGINVLLGTRIFGDKNDDDVNDLENVDETKDDQRLSTDDFGKIRRAQWFEVYEE